MAKRRYQFGSVERKQDRKGGQRPGYYVRFRVKGRRVRRYGGPTEEEAGAKLAEVQIRANRGWPLHEIIADVFGDGSGADALTFRDAAKQYLKDAAGRLKPSSLAMARHYLEAIGREKWAGRLVTEIRPRDLNRWAERLRTQGVLPSKERTKTVPLGPCSVNRYLSAASAVFGWCLKNEYLEANPCAGAERYKERGTERDTILDAKQALHLIASAPDRDFADILTLAVFTGLRRNEIVTLAWGDVSVKRRELTVAARNSKTSRPRTVPLVASAVGILKRRQKARETADGTELVFARDDGSAWTPIMFRRRWDKTLDAAKKLPATVRSTLVLHSLRHCFASFLANAGQPLDVIADLMGHSLQTTTLRYRHLIPETRRAAVDAVEKGLRALAKKRKASAK